MIESFLYNRLVVLFCGILLLLTSCSTKQDIVYFQNAKNFETIVDTDTFKAKLKIGDVVSIYVSTLDQTVTQPYNIIISNGNNNGRLIDYLIDVDG
ncbi:MAG TPA: polysaccharide export protein, partial [Mariniflexile sp.]